MVQIQFFRLKFGKFSPKMESGVHVSQWYEAPEFFVISIRIMQTAGPNVSCLHHNLALMITSGVSHCGLAIYGKKYLKAKEELWKLKYFTMQKYNLKKSSKRNQNPSIYYNCRTYLKFNTSQNISSFKNLHVKIDQLLPRGQNPLSYYTLWWI